MRLFEVQVLAGKVSLFNFDRDDRPSTKTFASEIERVGIYSMDMANQYASLEFYGLLVVLNFGANLSEAEEKELTSMNVQEDFARGTMGKLLFRVGVMWVGNV